MNSAAHHHDIAVPRGPLLAIAALLAFTLVAVGTSHWLRGAASPSAPTAAVVAQRLLQFTDRADGGITVRQVPEGTLVRDVPPGGEPFLRGALRALVRERRSQGQGAALPFQLMAHADGRLTLVDTATQQRLDLASFGPTQAAAFAQLLPAPRR